MAEEILIDHWGRISELVIAPFTDGRFVVKAGGRQIFSKAEAGRFPSKGEMTRLLGGS